MPSGCERTRSYRNKHTLRISGCTEQPCWRSPVPSRLFETGGPSMTPTMGARPWHKAYEAGVPTALDLEALTVSQFLERAATDHGDATAIIYFNRRLTYRQLKDHVNRFAAALAELGVTRDSRVAIQLPNIPQTVIAYYATLSLGAQAVMTNPLYT